MSAPQHIEHPPLEGSQRVWATIILSLATFMTVIDVTIANVAIPTIAGDLGVSPGQGTWVITSFAVANAIFVPLTGWLTQRFGQVRLFVVSVLLFTLASFLCGLSTSIEMLIACRILQGAVSGPMMPLSQTLLLSCYPRAKAGMAMAMWAMTTMVAPVIGPILGGWLSDNLSWPWIFYINVPTGIVAAWASWAIMKNRESPTHKRPVDIVGLIMLVIWVGTLQMIFDKGKELDWFHSPLIIGLSVVALITFCLFLVWELTDEHPIVDLRLFANRNFTLSVIVLTLGFGLYFANVVLMPLWLQQFFGYTATWAGLVTAPVGILALVLSPIVGKNVHHLDVRWLATVSFTIFALTYYMRMQFSTNTDVWHIVLPQLLQGAALATFFVPLSTLMLSEISPSRIASASGLANFVRLMFAGFGASISTTLWDSRAAQHHANLTEHINVYNPVAQSALANLEQSGFSLAESAALLERQIMIQAHTIAIDELFWGSCLLFLAMIVLPWFSRPKKHTGSPLPVDSSGAH